MKILKVSLLILIWAYLFMLYGGLAYDMKLFPYKLIKPVVEGAGHIQYLFSIDEHKRDIRWPVPAAGREDGVITSKPDRAHTGMTLVTTTHDLTARLRDPDGRVVHSWTVPIDQAWPEQAHFNMPFFHLPPRYFYLRDAHVYPDGSLLTLIHATGLTPWGVGMVKIDKDSQIEWSYAGHVNNDFELGPEGEIYLVEHEFKNNAELIPEVTKNGDVIEPAKTINDQHLEDHIVILGPDGEERKRIPLLQALSESEHASALHRINDSKNDDPTHTNSIDYVEQRTNLPPKTETGDLLISMRNIELMLVLDPETETIKHVIDVPARQQHDIDLLDNGNLLMFDNQGDTQGTHFSRVIELDPRTRQIEWAFSQTPEGYELNSKLFCESERYDNGHTMIVHGEYGELLEVDRKGEIYWRFVTPLRKTIEGTQHMPVITHAEHINPQQLEFLPKTDTP